MSSRRTGNAPEDFSVDAKRKWDNLIRLIQSLTDQVDSQKRQIIALETRVTALETP